jgi:hypothetical protein
MGRFLVVVGLLAVSARQAQAVEKTAIDRAIDKGVEALRKMQGPGGVWQHKEMGATALAGLALLECVGDKDDKAVQIAARRVREASYALTSTYSLSLAILFLDRLDNPADTPLIESMVVRLLAGQRQGGWDYECSPILPQEMRRLKTESEGKLRGGRDLRKLPAKGRRKTSDLPKEIQEQLQAIRLAGERVGRIDNSNTQFATLALWVGRRYGIPVQKALLRVDQHFRATQDPNGGWGYMLLPGGRLGFATGGTPTASMTCAGLLGLAVGHGAKLDLEKAKDPDLEKRDISKDAQIKQGLRALATAVGKPTGWSGVGRPSVTIPWVSGQGYYYLWSLERVAVAYSLTTIGKNDWYEWGAEALLVSQGPTGAWHGMYGTSGADTCFALLFLKRANFARDLTSGLSGGKKLGGTVLKAGGVGGGALKGDTGKGLSPTGIGKTKAPDRPRPKRGSPEEAASRLSDDLVRSAGGRRAGVLKKLRDTKGAAYTEALAGAIGRLDADGKREARAALADRLTRMKPKVLREYFKDDDAEIRRAAALAAAQKESKDLSPDLIGLLSDPEALVQRAAHAALKSLSGKDFGPRRDADPAERAKAVAAWRAWWKKEARE